MATVNTNELRVENATNFVASLSAANSYLFIGRPNAWPDDNAPPAPTNNWEEFYRTYDEMISLKAIAASDIYHMIPRVTWTSGIVYDMYKQNYSKVNTAHSGGSNLFDCNFFTVNQNRDVYVCLDNNGNTKSTVEPLSVGDINTPFYTSDGYQWLRIYTVSSAGWASSTNNFIPITSGPVVPQTEGMISTVSIDVPGTLYSSNGFDYVYCNINGDGTGAVAKITITASVVTKIEVVRGGSGYTFATLDFTPNNVYSSLVNLDAGTSGLNPEGDGTFRSTVIIPPEGGWGSNIAQQLGGTRIGVFNTLNPNDPDFVPDVKFRQVGIIQNAIPNDSPSPSTLSAYYAATVTSSNGVDFSVGETISQNVLVDGVARIAKGTVVECEVTSTASILKWVQTADDADTEGVLYRLSGGTLIVGADSGASVLPFVYDGTLEDKVFVGGYAVPEIRKYSGNMTYLSNISPVTRTAGQSEYINLIISY